LIFDLLLRSLKSFRFSKHFLCSVFKFPLAADLPCDRLSLDKPSPYIAGAQLNLAVLCSCHVFWIYQWVPSLGFQISFCSRPALRPGVPGRSPGDMSQALNFIALFFHVVACSRIPAVSFVTFRVMSFFKADGERMLPRTLLCKTRAMIYIFSTSCSYKDADF
jgi:hypothetical protein